MDYQTLPHDQKQRLLQAVRLLLAWVETEINNGQEQSPGIVWERPHHGEMDRGSLLAPGICLGAPVLDRPGDSFRLIWIDPELDQEWQGQTIP